MPEGGKVLEGGQGRAGGKELGGHAGWKLEGMRAGEARVGGRKVWAGGFEGSDHLSVLS